jgi:hypothetical protein
MRQAPLLGISVLGILCASLFLSAGLFVGACGDDPDPFVQICESSCSAEEAPACESKESQCISECIALAREAAQHAAYTGEQCGKCVAAESNLEQKTTDGCSATSTDPACCYGISHISAPAADPCASECYEPDGGPAY